MSRVLVLDDDPAISRLIKLILESASLEVTVSNRGEDALLLLESEHPGLIVLDLAMPGMDGPTFLEKARAAGFCMPVLIVSAHDARHVAHMLGAEGALDKPFDPDDLVQQVEELIAV